MANRVLHVQTVITTTFGIPDGDDIEPLQPIQVPINKFSEEAFVDAYHKIYEQREEAKKQRLLSVNGDGGTPARQARRRQAKAKTT